MQEPVVYRPVSEVLLCFSACSSGITIQVLFVLKYIILNCIILMRNPVVALKICDFREVHLLCGSTSMFA